MTGQESPLVTPAPVNILGIPVHPVTMAQTLDWIRAAVAARQPRQVCTANPEFIMTAQRDAAFRQVLRQADLVLPDGVGLLWAARRRGARLPERVAGSDLIYRLAERGAEHGWRIFFLGAAEGVAARAAGQLQARWPGLTVAGAYSGSPLPEHDEAQAALVRAARPDILLAAYGAPRQDLWIARNRERLETPVSIGVGGALDFAAGEAQRAPGWVQRAGLEWLHRLWRQPWRARRIFTAVVAFPLAVMAAGRSNPE